MSAKTTEMATGVAARTVAATERNLELLQEFVEETVADETFQLPPGVTVLLLPDDDPAFAEGNIASGLAAIREGKNVYFHHLHRRDEGREAGQTSP